MNNKKLITIILSLFVLLMAIGGTIAYFTWASNNEQKTNVALTFITDSENLSCSADGGGDISSSDLKLAPTTCTNKKYAIQRTVTLNTTQESGTSASLSLWLKVNSISQNLASTSNFKYAITTNANSCTTGVINSGTFQGTTANSELPLIDEKTYEQSTANDTYYLYIWLDEAETNLNTMSQSFNFSLGGECTDTPAKVGKPELTDGLIPVTIANDGTVTAVSKTDPTWYDYDNQVWANAVLTTSTNRSIYQSIANGNADSQAIPSNEILAYYVWIPRYSYKIWTLDASQTHQGDEQTIDIKIVDKLTKERGTTVGSYYTHPAFTFGNDELSGFWVGKFEATGTASQPTILPNLDSLSNQNIGTQFATSLKFAGGTQSGSAVTFAGNNAYGLTSTADSHMMKNSEWGAVAYLSHSNYGINGEIRINNYWNNNQTLTGCGASTANASESATCGIAYGSTTSYPQSTTGNITGIFDMSGGAWEYVMGHWSDNLNASGETSGFSTLPTSKYIDIYPSNVFTGNSSTNIALCTLSTCGGHALYEITNWYSDSSYFANSNYPWFIRGGERSFIDYAGLSSFNSDDGGVDTYNSWRSTLIPNVTPTIPTFTITLDNDSATTNGTTTLYGKYNDGIYLDSNYHNKMTTGLNNITIPQRINSTFDGYYDGNTKMIDEDGYITNSLTSILYSSNVTLNAHWLLAEGVPVYSAKYVSNDSTYNSNTWTKDSVYVELTTTSPNAQIVKFQYSINNGTTWTDLTCAKSNGITVNDSTYSCQQAWTATGENSILFRTVDSGSNNVSTTTPLTIKYDTDVPTGTIAVTNVGTTATATLTANDATSGIGTPYYFKVLTTNTCGTGTEGTTGFIDNEDSNSYNFMFDSEETYYICSKVYDLAGNYSYVSQKFELYARAYLKSLAGDTEFKSSDYKQKIQKIQVVNYIDLNNSVANWNLANDGSNAIKGWLVNNTTYANNYDLYIGSDSRIYATNLTNAFQGMSYATNINLTGLYTRETTNMSRMFNSTGMYGYSNAPTRTMTLDFGNNFNTSNVTDMSEMFKSTGSYVNHVSLVLKDNFNTGKVTNMYAMFENYGHSTRDFELKLGNNFDTKKVTNMANMFTWTGYNSRYFNLSLGDKFDAGNVTNMANMFSYTALNTIYFNLHLGNNFNASKIENMVWLFYPMANYALEYSLNLGNNFNASNATNMYEMFEYSGINATNFNLDLGNNFNASKATNMYSMFYGSGNRALNWSFKFGNNFNATNVTNLYELIAWSGTKAVNLSIDFGNNFNAVNATDISYMFYGVGANARSVNMNLSNFFNTRKVTNLNGMFGGVGRNATDVSINLGNDFDTKNVLYAGAMFDSVGQNATNLNINLGNKFDTSNMDSVAWMFMNVGQNATNLNIYFGDKFNLTNSTYAANMFYNFAKSAPNNFTIDLSAGNFANITNFVNMFKDFGNNKATIYVKDPESQDWIINKNTEWDQNFDTYNVVVKNINYHLNGGSFATTPLYSMKDRNEDYTLPTPIKTGYAFLGWTGTNGDVPQTIVVIPAGTLGIVHYEANWTESTANVPTYQIKYNNDDSAYTSTWTKDAIYVDISTNSVDSAIQKFQYSLNNGENWVDMSCGESSGIQNSDNTYSCQSTWSAEGDNKVIFRAIDADNKASNNSGEVTIKYDISGPTGEIMPAINGSMVTASVNATDELSGLAEQYYFKILTTNTCGTGTDGTTNFIDNENINSYTFSAANATTYYICAKTVDNVGNNTYISRQFNISDKAYLKLLDTDTDFKASSYKQKIEKIEVVDYINLTNSIANWNLANDGTGSIKGWIISNTINQSNYDLYIGSDKQIYAINLSNTFNSMNFVSSINLSGLHTSETTDMSLFLNATGSEALNFNINLGNNFDTSNVTNMSGMFAKIANKAATFNLNLGHRFNTNNVTNMSGMFSSTGSSARNWDIVLGNNFDTSNVTNMAGMFSIAGKTATIWNVNFGDKFNTSKVTDVTGMFSSAGESSRDVTLNLGDKFDLGNVTSLLGIVSSVGQNATNLSIDLGDNFNASRVTSLSYTFSSVGANATNFSFNLGNNFNVSNVENMAGMFIGVGQNSTNFSLNLGNNFNASNATSMQQMFYIIGANATNWNLTLGNNFNSVNVTNMYQMFGFIGQNVRNFNFTIEDQLDVSNVTDMSYMFMGLGQNSNQMSLDLGNNFNSSKVTNMAEMFYLVGQNATNWNLNINNKINTSNVTNMASMFGVTGLNTANYYLDLGDSFNTSKVTTMSYMFAPSGLNAVSYTLKLGNNFDTSNVTNMAGMFGSAGLNSKIINVDFGNKFNISNVTNMFSTFGGFGNHAQSQFVIDISAGEINSAAAYNNMFADTGNNKAIIYVKDPTVQNWVISKNSDWNQHFDVYNVVVNNINYYLEGGAFAETPLYSMKGRSESYTLPTPTKQGHTFLGWTGSNGDTPELTVVIPVGTTEILRYTAMWSNGATTPTYQVKYAANDNPYTSGTWTNDSLYIEMSSISPDIAIKKFQYSINNGSSWSDITCDKSNGITNTGNTYSCQTNWTTSGDYSMTFRAITNADEATSASSVLNLKYDNDLPTGTIETTVTGSTVGVRLDANDDTSGIAAPFYFKILTSNVCGAGEEGTTNFVNNEGSNEYNFTALEETNYYICAKIVDNAGNISYVSKLENISDEAYLKLLAAEIDFKDYEYRSKIKKIEVVDYINTTNAVNSWNLGANNTDIIKGWIVNNSVNSSNYDLYIGSDHRIFANNLHNIFSCMTVLSNLNLEKLYTNKTNNMSNMFASTSTSSTIDSLNFKLGNNFDTSNVDTMANMFYYFGSSLPNLRLDFSNINSFNTSNVRTMSSMFYGLGYSSTNWYLNLGNNFNTSNVIDMFGMFGNAGTENRYFALNLGNNFNTSNVVNMQSLFYSTCRNSTSCSISFGNQFYANNVMTMDRMFYSFARNVTNFSLNLNSIKNTTNVKILYWTFAWAGDNATTWNLNLGNNFNTINVVNMNGMFVGAAHNSSATTLNLGNNFDTSNVLTMSNMFNNFASESSTFSLNLGDKFNTSKVSDMSNMFAWAGEYSSYWNLNLGNHFNTGKVKNMFRMFYSSGAMNQYGTLNLGNEFDTSNVTNMEAMFYNWCSRCRTVNLNLGNSFNTSNLNKAGSLFYNVGSIATSPFTINLAAGSLTNVSNYTGMFTRFGNNKATIIVKDQDSQNWIISKNWGMNFSATNVLIDNINYYLNGGSFSTTPLYSMKGRSESYTLPTPTKSGYVFAGWTGSNGNTPQTTVTIPAGTTTILRYTANWAVDISALNVGDYLSYTPSSTSYHIDSSKTGYTDEAEYINPSELNLWRILSIGNNGTVEIISVNSSTGWVTFNGKIGYQNFTSYLNTIASQYETSGITVGSKHLGYNGQTGTISDMSIFNSSPPWTCDTGESCNPVESQGGGDTLYLSEYNRVKNILGTSAMPRSYLPSRHYSYDTGNDYYVYGYHVNSSGEAVSTAPTVFFYYASGSYETGPVSEHVRPIVTLKSGLSYSGAGTSSNPWTIVG